MDPKSASSLDPKLKEVYDRVMGSANPQSAPPPQTTSQTPLSPPASPVQSQLPHPPTPLSPPLSTPDHPSSPQVASVTPNPLHSVTDKPPGMSTPLSPPAPPSSSLGKPTVDYAALAAKYATPTPNISNVSMNSHQTPVTPSSTIYGVVDNKAVKSEKEKKTENKGSSSKKILLLALIPIILIGYTAVWTFIFHVDILGFLPLPK